MCIQVHSTFIPEWQFLHIYIYMYIRYLIFIRYILINYTFIIKVGKYTFIGYFLLVVGFGFERLVIWCPVGAPLLKAKVGESLNGWNVGDGGFRTFYIYPPATSRALWLMTACWRGLSNIAVGCWLALFVLDLQGFTIQSIPHKTMHSCIL